MEISKNNNVNFEKARKDSQAALSLGSKGPVMLALSTFKYFDKAIDAAIENASQCKKLVIVYGHEVGLWLYFLETDIGFYPHWKEQCEKELLTGIHHQWSVKVEGFANRAKAASLKVTTYVRAKRFRTLCMEVVKKEKPSLIIIKQNLRTDWFRSIFGSTADYFTSHTGCSVIEI